MLPHPLGLAERFLPTAQPSALGSSFRSEPVFGGQARAEQAVQRVFSTSGAPVRGGEWARTLSEISLEAAAPSAPEDVDMQQPIAPPAPTKAANRGGRVSQLAQERLFRRAERPYARRRVCFEDQGEAQAVLHGARRVAGQDPFHRLAEEAAREAGSEGWACMVRRHQLLPLLRALGEASAETLTIASADIFLMTWLRDSLSTELRLYREEAVPSAYLHFRDSVQRALDALTSRPITQALCPSIRRKLLGLLTEPLTKELTRQASATVATAAQDLPSQTTASASTQGSHAAAPADSLVDCLDQLRL